MHKGNVNDPIKLPVNVQYAYATWYLGREAPVQVMDSIFNDENADVVLLIDSENAFSSVIREVFKLYILCFCYICFKFLFQVI